MPSAKNKDLKAQNQKNWSNCYLFVRKTDWQIVKKTDKRQEGGDVNLDKRSVSIVKEERQEVRLTRLSLAQGITWQSLKLFLAINNDNNGQMGNHMFQYLLL
jgi:hypothetical protein